MASESTRKQTRFLTRIVESDVKPVESSNSWVCSVLATGKFWSQTKSFGRVRFTWLLSPFFFVLLSCITHLPSRHSLSPLHSSSIIIW